METLAPIVLFVYNRPDHVERTLTALRNNYLATESDLIVYSDSFKDDDSAKRVQEVRSYLKSIRGFHSITIIERERNLGLSENIIHGVTETVLKYGKIIVIEDDLVTSPSFLQFMNDGLTAYEQEEKVISIHGYIYPVKGMLPETFFLRGADCWGWATWKRGWNLFENNGKKLLEEIKSKRLENDFNFNGCYPFLRMLEKQVAGKIDSWAIRWYASAFLARKLTLYPGKSLIQNIGIDNSGTHHKHSTILDVSLADEMPSIKQIPVREDEEAYRLVAEFIKNLHPPLWKRIFKKVGSLTRLDTSYVA